MLNNIICKKLLVRKKSVFCFKKCLILVYLLVWLEKKKKLDLPKNYGINPCIKRLPYIRNEDPSFQNSIIDIVNNRSDFKKFLLDKSDYGRSIQENINAVVADGKFNQAVDSGTLDQKNKGVFESPILLSVTSKDAKKIDIQNPVIGNLLSQVNMNKISDAKVKQLLGQAKDDEIQARLNKLRKRIDKNGDNNNNTNSDDSDVDDDDEDDNDSGDELR